MDQIWYHTCCVGDFTVLVGYEKLVELDTSGHSPASGVDNVVLNSLIPLYVIKKETT